MGKLIPSSRAGSGGGWARAEWSRRRRRYEGKPGWFSLIARSASPMGLLPFRYTVQIDVDVFHTQRLTDAEDKFAAGVNPAAKAVSIRRPIPLLLRSTARRSAGARSRP